jgi:hypothetical protein
MKNLKLRLRLPVARPRRLQAEQLRARLRQVFCGFGRRPYRRVGVGVRGEARPGEKHGGEWRLYSRRIGCAGKEPERVVCNSEVRGASRTRSDDGRLAGG